MEAFSLLKYWRGGGGVHVGGGDSSVTSRSTTILTAVAQHAVETEDDDGDDGPFFDLEFSVPDEDEGEEEEEEEEADKKQSNGAGFEQENDDVESDDDDEDDEGEEREFKFTLSSDSSNDRVDQNLALSPSDDLFFKGRLVPIEPSSLVVNGSEPNSKPQFPVSFLKSATKFRVFMLGFNSFKKSKMNATEKAPNVKATEANESAASPNSPKQQQKQEENGEETNAKQNKFFTVKFKVEEVPIVSLFTRETSKSAEKLQKQSNTEESATGLDEKRFSKDVMQKYLKKVKPLYIRVSKRYGEKLRFSGQLSLGSGLKAAACSPVPSTAAAAQKSSPPKSTTSTEKSQPETEIAEAPSASNVKNPKQGNFPAGLRVVCKHLGKSRSASSAVAAAPPSASAMSRRRDDSLLQQQDGIQSAILHCKRSFNASRDSDSSQLSRSVSDPSHEKSVELTRTSADEGKVSSL